MLGSGSSSVALFLTHLLLVSVLFLLIFGAIALAFARERIGHLMLGFARNLGSFFYSPFVYLRKIVLELCDFGYTGDAGLIFSDQYLLNKVLIALKAALIVFAIGGLAASFTAAWEATLPPQELRQAIEQMETTAKKDKTDLAAASARVQQMDADWQARRQSLIDQFKNQTMQGAQTAANENAQIERSAQGSSSMGQALESVRNYLEQNESVRFAYQLDSARNSAKQFLDRLSMSDGDRVQLVQYVDNWHSQRLAKLQLESMSENQLRTQVQSDYYNLKNQSAALSSRVQGEQGALEQLYAQAKYHPELGLVAGFTGILVFILTIWIAGLFLEGAVAAGAMADDIKKMRLLSEKESASVRAA